MKGGTILLAMVLSVGGLVAGCSRERNRAVSPDENEAAAEGPRDYQEMLSRARNKSSHVDTLNRLEDAIQRFQYELARLPTNLNELANRGYLAQIPPPPPGQAYTYNPVHGNVGIVDLPDGSGIKLPDEATNTAPARLQEVPLPAMP